MFSPNDCFVRTPELRIRPVPELGRCMVFTPARPHLYTLNAAAWLALELCDGRSLSMLEAAYVDMVGEVGGGSSSGDELRTTLEEFERKGIIVRASAPPGAKSGPLDDEEHP